MRLCQIDFHTPQCADGSAMHRAVTLGFDHVLLTNTSVLHVPRDTLASAAAHCRAQDLGCVIDLALDRYPHGGPPIDPTWPDHGAGYDPRETDAHLQGLRLRWHEPGAAQALVGWWADRLRELADLSIAGFVCRAPARVAGRHWRALMAALGADRPKFLAWTPGTTPAQAADLAAAGFDGAFISLPWWDYRSTWLAEEMTRLRPFGKLYAAPALRPEGMDALAARRALWTAAALGDGLMVPSGFECGDLFCSDEGAPGPYDLSAEVIHANAWQAARVHAPGLVIRQLSGRDAPLTVLARLPAPDAGIRTPVAIVVNPDANHPAAFCADRVLSGMPQGAAALVAVEGGPGGSVPAGTLLDATDNITVAPAGIQLFYAAPASHTEVAKRNGKSVGKAVRTALERSVATAIQMPRVAIENVQPAVDHGRFAVRRVTGERVEASADIWMDGHDVLAAALLWRAPGDEKDTWRETPMTKGVNDRWHGSFPLVGVGRHLYTVIAWHDSFATWCDEVTKKKQAGLNVSLETEEGARLVAAAEHTRAAREHAVQPALHELLEQLEAARADEETGDDRRLEILLTPQTRQVMQAADPRQFLVRHPVEMPVEADRLAGRFASWYEIFPRSQSGDGVRHGDFDDVIRRLPEIREMGFDVLYFPPIHPIGQANRKGRNNSLRAEPGDPGSPYAIGAAEGGHDAIHPELGTLDDFLRLVDAAARHGMELALDFAIQCSPDHPWLRDHPEWFAHRPDGSLRYAENPPKKYEDIVNVDFYAKAGGPQAAALWIALRDVIMFWAKNGVRIFRVDNPHTKPLPFWEWMIADVRKTYPDTLFLAEAFTRPKMMARLAKLGFSQSYTYFTWRNHKQELTEYMSELTQTPLREYFRPHFFVNTPDINPYFLHDSGRPGFLIRAALATTLSGLWGVYNGFEVCEGTPLVVNGVEKEEYLDSEKYQFRVWDLHRPGNIVAEITRLNAIRNSHPALQNHLGLRFLHASDDAMLWYARFVPRSDYSGGGEMPRVAFGDDVLLVAVSLDPRAAREGDVELPLWEWGLPDHGALAVHDLMHGHRFTWHGKRQRMRLDPGSGLPFGVWQVWPWRGD